MQQTLSNGQNWHSLIKIGQFNNSGYPHYGRADKNPYPHDRRADKYSYP